MLNIPTGVSEEFGCSVSTIFVVDVWSCDLKQQAFLLSPQVALHDVFGVTRESPRSGSKDYCCLG